MRNVQFSSLAFDEYNEWIQKDRDAHSKIKELIKDILRDTSEDQESLNH